ncbi:hypothetical protein I8751_13220 [Nostocaceae cyanobacterium CENA357]|uniref:Uncharacterized protein n=1 Tax=Atlanticothrix silvestris CENA357 TaxID=1725252 RepID=A0A8J7HDB2_9CYAN|nr:hypothetical protein [Atlanticothrix silvestris]MBH8553317.1 hypothetical protein [Atlanticothrix silvestris CENA357]
MALDTLIVKEKIGITLDANSGATAVPIYTYIPFSRSGYRLINEYLEVNNLRATSWIYSLAKVQFPVFELEDTESKQALAAVNLEWKSPRIQMDLVLNLNNTNTWQRLAAFSLLNPDPYPYREFDLGSHSLGSNSMIGIQIRNVGYGLLQNSVGGQDKVTVYGDLTRTVLVERTADVGSKIANNITTTPSTVVLQNVNRKGLTFTNTSTKTVFIDIANTVSITSYLVKIEPGFTYEAPSPIYTGDYWGIVESGSTAIDIREFQ